MHPINKKNFGVGKLLVKFHNGTGVVSGYITKQSGADRFVVTDGTITKTVTLAQTTTLAQKLTGELTYDSSAADLATITLTVDAATHYVKKILDRVAYTTAGGTFSWTTGVPAGTVYGASNYGSITPVNSVLPAITGTAQTGVELTVSTGTWSNTPSSYTYQWNADGVAIVGATLNAYTPVVDDEGSVLTVTVNAVKFGTAPVAVTSAATAAVIAA